MVDFTEYGVAETDIEFLRQKELEGNLIIVRGTKAGTGELVAYTPSSGKTFFLYRASISARHSGDEFCRATLQNDGVDVDDFFAIAAWATFDAGGGKLYSTIVGDSLVGDGVKKYRINIDNANGTTAGTIIGWIEDT